MTTGNSTNDGSTGWRVSCVVPLYNGELYVRETLDSILAQTYPAFEVVVVDDGSTDGSASIVAEFGDAIRYVRQVNSGPATARNRGIAATTGDLIAFLDADDLWHPEKLRVQVGALRDHPNVSYVVSLIQNFWVSDLADEAAAYRGHPRAEPMPGYVFDCLLARRQAIERVGLIDTTRAQSDATDWFLRARAAGLDEFLVPEVLTRRRIHKTSWSRLNADASRDEFLHLLKQGLDRRRAADSTRRAP